MPLYEMICRECSEETEVLCSVAERKLQTCLLCDGLLDNIIGPVPTIGAMPSKPISFGKQGLSFETNAAFRAYERAHPEERVISKTDTRFTQMRDRAREDGERKAKRAGFRDVEDLRSTWKKGFTEPQ